MKKPLILKEIFETFQKENPTPLTELDYSNDFTLLVAIALSAQTTDIAVNKATKQLFKLADSPEKMLSLGEEEIKKHIKTIGLFNSKAKNIILLCKKIISDFSGKIPTDFESLVKLPGVGNKTAAVFLNCFYKQPLIAVDTHVFRVSNRIGLVNTKTADETAEKLNKIIPIEFKLYAHHWLILHGRYVCKARKPDCNNCKINSFCKFFMQNKNS